MMTKGWRRTLAMLLALLLIAACGGAPTPAPAVPTATPVPPTLAPTSPPPTSTPLPPTPTATPLPTVETAPTSAVDHTDPASVLEAVFAAARSGDTSLLPTLCDPLDEHDGDAAFLCSITPDRADWAQFVAYFSTARVRGEPAIQGDVAKVRFLYGPGGDQQETMTLILRDGAWYLLGF